MDVTVGICLVLVITAPLLIRRYVRGLPVAPACPCCNAVTRQVHDGADPLRFLPYLVSTSRGECTRCGWHGRMRWRWAPRTIPGPPG